MKSFAFVIAILATAIAARADDGRRSVILLPFTPIDHAADNAWIGEAVGRSLQTDLSRGGSLRIQLPAQGASTTFSNDPAAIAHLAHDSSADFVVAGQFQMIDDQIRLTGQLFDGHTGETIGLLKATGAIKNLFDLEDAVAEQIQHGLRAAVPKQAVTAPMPVVEESGPLRVAVQRPGPVGTVEERYTSRSAQIGRDHYIYMAPFLSGYCGYCGYGWCGYSFPYTRSFFGGGASVGFATGGTGSLAY